MSAWIGLDVRFGSEADIRPEKSDVRFTCKSGHRSARRQCLLCAKSGLMQCSNSRLFDHLVGTAKQWQRDVEAKHLGGFEIDHQVELDCLDDGQVARLFALENPSGVIACLAVQVALIGAVTHQTSGSGKFTLRVDGSNPVVARKF